ncbi:hypothetical protein ACFCXS_02485 [Streptomyces sp. NPDC056373]|uniref:hypothetical protein n=1 Tax=Streptomyces sp. NPDC056373 TaxID=3345798 RepID=UPI0035DA23DC
MSRGWDWESGEGLLRLDDPEEWDAAFERGESRLGTAAISLAYHRSPAELSLRIVRAMWLPDEGERGFAFTATGHVACLNGELTPELYAALRAEGPGGLAAHPTRDTLTFVPFRTLPPWFKWRWVYVTVGDRLEAWWLRCVYAVGDAWRAVRRRGA